MKKLFLALFLLMTMICLTAAAPPFIQSKDITSGYTIKVPPFGAIPINQDFTFNFHVFNISNGVPIDNSSTTCYLHLYNMNGLHTFEGKVPYDITAEVKNEWEIKLLGSNFSTLGDIGYVVSCNSTTNNLGGEETINLRVTTKGYTLETSEMLLYFMVLFVLLFFWTICVYGGFTIPYRNITNNDNEIIKVNWEKYLKILCISLAYFFLIAIEWLVWNLIYAYSEWYQLETIFHFIYRFMMAFALPVFIAVIILVVVKLGDDKKINKFVKKMGIPYKPF